MTSNTKCVGYYLRSLVITAIVTFLLPLVLLGGLLLVLLLLPVLVPGWVVCQQAAAHLQNFLAVLGNQDPWQGALLISTASSLVGMLFDTYAFYRYQGVTHRWFD